MPQIIGVYKIYSTIKPNRVYVGSSANIKQRWRTHKAQLNHNKHKNPKLQRHCNKYGLGDLLFEIIETIPNGSKEQILEREQFFIDLIKPWFNISPMSSSPLGSKRSAESKAKYRKAVLGRKASDETRKKQSDAKAGYIPWNKGIKWSADVIVNISNARKKRGRLEYLYGIMVKRVYQYDINMNFVNKYKTVTEASTILGLIRETIGMCCNNKRNTPYGGFYFAYVLEICSESNDFFSPIREKWRGKYIRKGKF